MSTLGGHEAVVALLLGQEAQRQAAQEQEQQQQQQQQQQEQEQGRQGAANTEAVNKVGRG